MNALEQEYRDNVVNSRIRNDRRMFTLGTIGCLIVAGAFTWVDHERGALLFVVAFMRIAFAFVGWRLKLASSRPVVTTPVASDAVAVGYRDAVIPPTPPIVTRRFAMPFAPNALVVLLVLAAALWFGCTEGSSRIVSTAVVGIGFVVVIVTQHIHAAWKKRHDAKLMLEWERRLEEMK